MENTNIKVSDLCYYDSALGIDGTADELASFAERYTDDYSDEALQRIIKILEDEGKPEKALRVSLELESRHEVKNGKRDLGRLKLWALDGMYELIDNEHDANLEITLISELKRNHSMVLHVRKDSGESTTCLIPWSEFLLMEADDFEKKVNEAAFYAQPED